MGLLQPLLAACLAPSSQSELPPSGIHALAKLLAGRLGYLLNLAAFHIFFVTGRLHVDMYR